MPTELEFREINLHDLRTLEGLKKDFPMPDVNSPLYFVKHAVYSDGKLLGAVFTYLTSEISLILDESQSKLTRARAIDAIFTRLNKELYQMGLRDTHLFIIPETDEQYARFLIKKYGFSRAPGIPLYYRKD